MEWISFDIIVCLHQIQRKWFIVLTSAPKNQVLSFLSGYVLIVCGNEYLWYTHLVFSCLIIHCKNQTRTIDKCFRVPPSMNICFSYIKDVNDDEELTWECFDIILSFKNSLGSNTLFSHIHTLNICILLQQSCCYFGTLRIYC